MTKKADAMRWVLRSYSADGDADFVLRGGVSSPSGLAGEMWRHIQSRALSGWLVRKLGHVVSELRGHAVVGLDDQEIAQDLWDRHAERFLLAMYMAHRNGKLPLGDNWEAMERWVLRHAKGRLSESLHESANRGRSGLIFDERDFPPPAGMKPWVHAGYSPVSQWKKGVRWAINQLDGLDAEGLDEKTLKWVRDTVRRQGCPSFKEFKRVVLPQAMNRIQPEVYHAVDRLNGVIKSKLRRPSSSKDVPFWRGAHSVVLAAKDTQLQDWFDGYLREARADVLEVWYNLCND